MGVFVSSSTMYLLVFHLFLVISLTQADEDCSVLIDYSSLQCEMSLENLIHIIHDIEDTGECQKMCKDHSSCNYFTHYSPPCLSPHTPCVSDCLLFHDCSTTLPCSSCTSGPTTPDWERCKSHCDVFSQGEVCNMVLDNVIEVDRGDYSEILCQERCINSPHCNFFSFVNWTSLHSVKEESECVTFRNCSSVEPCPEHLSCFTGPVDTPVKPCVEEDEKEKAMVALLIGGESHGTSHPTPIQTQIVDGQKLCNLPIKLPYDRIHGAAALLDSTIIFCGGKDLPTSTSHGNCLTMDLSSLRLQWRTSSPMNYPRAHFGAVDIEK